MGSSRRVPGPREGFGGSTTHFDGLASFSAMGGIKDGLKSVTAVEAPDAFLALELVEFLSYAKPGGGTVNLPITAAHKEVWKEHGIRHATFELRAGDFYAIPPGMPHEFVNKKPCTCAQQQWNTFK